jgi:putative spermidine/putrescine transport system ATP-binding protein
VNALKVNVDKGDRTMLSLRPERVLVNPDSGEVPSVLDGTIEELIYLGDHMRSRMTVAGHDDFIVKVANSHGHEHLKQGAKVKIGWHTTDCRALDNFTGTIE